MAMPGPKPKPDNVRHLYPPSHRPDEETVQLPIEAPDEPDWAAVFPPPKARAEIAKHSTLRERQQMPSADLLDIANARARKIAHATWALIVPDLHSRQLLAKVDQLALKDLCVVVARLDQLEREISSKGALYITERGLVKNPATTVAKSYREQFNRLMPEFGLSPSARTRLKAQSFGTDEGDGLFD